MRVAEGVAVGVSDCEGVGDTGGGKGVREGVRVQVGESVGVRVEVFDGVKVIVGDLVGAGVVVDVFVGLEVGELLAVLVGELVMVTVAVIVSVGATCTEKSSQFPDVIFTFFKICPVLEFVKPGIRSMSAKIGVSATRKKNRMTCSRTRTIRNKEVFMLLSIPIKIVHDP